jgi:hypothetical protein
MIREISQTAKAYIPCTYYVISYNTLLHPLNLHTLHFPGLAAANHSSIRKTKDSTSETPRSSTPFITYS